MNIAGLEFSGKTIRAVLMSRKLGKTNILRSTELELPETEAERVDTVRGLLMDWKEEHGLGAVAVGLEFREFIHEELVLPISGKEDIRRALPFEIEGHLPLPAEEYVLDGHPLEQTPDGYRTLVMAIKRSRLRWLLRSLKDTGLRFLGLRCTLIEVLNEFLTSDGHDRADSLVAYPAGTHCYLAGLRGGKPDMLRSIPLQRFESELKDTAPHYQNHLYMVGATAQPPAGLEAERLPYDTAELTARAVFRSRMPFFLDFTPEELMTPRKDRYPQVAAALLIVAVLLFFATDIVAYLKERSALKQTEARIEEIKPRAFEINKQTRELEKIEGRIEALETFKLRKNLPIRVLSEASRMLPSEAWITNFSVDINGSVELRGVAARADRVIEPLENSALFKNVEFTSAITRQDNMQRFSIGLEVEDPPPPSRLEVIENGEEAAK